MTNGNPTICGFTHFGQSDKNNIVKNTEEKAAGNSTYPKDGFSCSKDSFVVNQTLVFQIKFCGNSPAFWVAAKRYAQATKQIS